MKREETTNPFCFAKRVCDPAKLLNHEMLDLPVSSLSEALDELAIFVRCSLPDALRRHQGSLTQAQILSKAGVGPHLRRGPR